MKKKKGTILLQGRPLRPMTSFMECAMDDIEEAINDIETETNNQLEAVTKKYMRAIVKLDEKDRIRFGRLVGQASMGINKAACFVSTLGRKFEVKRTKWNRKVEQAQLKLLRKDRSRKPHLRFS